MQLNRLYKKTNYQSPNEAMFSSVDYTGTQSFITTISCLLTQKLWLLLFKFANNVNQSTEGILLCIIIGDVYYPSLSYPLRSLIRWHFYWIFQSIMLIKKGDNKCIIIGDVYYPTLSYPLRSLCCVKVIRLVGEHMSGKLTLSPLHLAEPHIPLQVSYI